MSLLRSTGTALVFSSAIVFGACEGSDEGMGVGAGGSGLGGAPAGGTSAGGRASGGNPNAGGRAGGTSKGGVSGGGCGLVLPCAGGSGGQGGSSASGGSGGEPWVSACRCTGKSTASCTTELVGFCGAEPACANDLTTGRRKVATWLSTDRPPIYQECDDGSARIEVAWGGENLERLIFDRVSGALLYGYADGYLAWMCGRREADLCWSPSTGIVTEASNTSPLHAAICDENPLDVVVVTAGTEPLEATCRSCRVRVDGVISNEGGAGGQGGSEGTNSPFCVVGDDGQVALP